MSERFVIVHRSYDPIIAEHLGQMLREAGIGARVLGTRSAALIGVGQNIMQMHIEVPLAHAGAATDFLEAYFEADGAQLLAEEGLDPDEADAEDDDDGEPVADNPELSALLAAGSCVLIFGFGHIYSRRIWTAVAIAAGQVWGIRVFINSTEWAGIVTGTVVFATLMLCDVLGSQVAVREYNRGTRRSPAYQIAIGAAFVTLAVALGSLIGPRVPEPPDRDSDPYAVPIPAQY